MKDTAAAPRALPRWGDYLRASLPLALCPAPGPIIQSRARVDLRRLNEAAGRNRKEARP